MTDIAQARTILAKWRAEATPTPWQMSLQDEGMVSHYYVAHRPAAPQPVEDVAQTWDDADARLIVGATDPELLDAIDGLFDVLPQGERVTLWAERIAAAILAADERMSA